MPYNENIKNQISYKKLDLLEKMEEVKMTNNELMGLFIEDQKWRVCKSTLQRRCRALNNHYLPLFGLQEVKDVDENNCYLLFDKMRSGGYSESFIYSTYESVYEFYKYAMRLGIIDNNPIMPDAISKDYRRVFIIGSKKHVI